MQGKGKLALSLWWCWDLVIVHGSLWSLIAVVVVVGAGAAVGATQNAREMNGFVVGLVAHCLTSPFIVVHCLSLPFLSCPFHYFPCLLLHHHHHHH